MYKENILVTPAEKRVLQTMQKSNCMCCKVANIENTFISTVSMQRYNIYTTSYCKTEHSIHVLVELAIYWLNRNKIKHYNKETA